MSNLPTEDISRFNSLIEKFALIKEEYGNNYPIILYEPSINCQEKRVLRDLLQGKDSINLFAEFKEACKFIQSLGISYILIVSQSEFMDEKTVLRNFGSLGNTCSRTMFDFEEEALLKDLFQEISDAKLKSLKLKAYVFITLLDLMNESPVKEDEEEIMIIPSVKEMAEKFRQEYNVVWYDPCICSVDKEALKQQFDIEERNIFDNFKELEKRIDNSNSINPPSHLILTGKDEAEKIVSKIGQLKESLICLYIYCNDPDITKVKGRNIFVEKTLKELIPRIKEGIRTKSKLTNSFPAFATDFDALDKSHIYNLHYYLRGLINFQNRKQAKSDFLHLAKGIYQSKKIFEFEQEYDKYDKEKIFKWYTIESPVYKLVNNCLRIATSDSILYCRFILRDLEKAIREKYHEKSHQFSGVTYRGAYISQKEWEKLQKNVGKEIEMYGFLSTSQNIETAKNFLYSDLKNKILITIIIPPLPAPELNEQGFAHISQNSGFQEAEILFNVRSKFQVVEAGVIKLNSQGKECHHLVLFYGAQLLREYMSKHQPAISLELKLPSDVKCNLCRSTKELFAFQQGITEVRCFECLRKSSIPHNVPLLALGLGEKAKESEVIAKSFKGQILLFNQAINLPYYGYKCYQCQKGGKEKYYKWINLETREWLEQCSDCFEGAIKVESHILVAETNPFAIWQESQPEWETVNANYQTELSGELKGKSHGDVYLDVYRYDLCLEYERKFINKLKRVRRRELSILRSFQRMGKANGGSRNYEKALEFYFKALGVMKVGFQEKDLYPLYSLIACAYRDLGQNQVALVYLRRCWEIGKVTFGEKHSETAKLYFAIGMIHQSLGHSQETLKYFEEALNINKAVFGHKHPETAISYKNFAAVCMTFGQHQESLEYYTKALNIDKAIFGDKHPTTVLAYSQCGLVYERLGQYQKALEFGKKGLDLKISIYGDKHAFILQSYSNLGSICQSLQKYQEALEYVRKALNLSKEIFGEMHSMTALQYSQCAGAYHDLGQFQEALELHKKALDIRKARLGDGHPETASSYCSYARAWMELGQYQEGLKYSQQAMDICQRVFGEMHPMTATAYNCYRVCYERLGGT